MMEPIHKRDPATASASQLSDFARFVERETGQAFADYRSLHAFSTREADRFWILFLRWSGAATEGAEEPARAGTGFFETRFFPALRLSWAENVLSERSPHEESATAVVSVDETGARAETSRAELRRRVRTVAAGLEAMGLREGDRVAAVVRNTLDTLVACLAVTSLGATWSSLAPDMGRDAALARLVPLEPKLLLVHGSARQNGARIEPPVQALVDALPSLETVVRLGAAGDDPKDAAPASATGRVVHTTFERVESLGQDRPSLGPWRRFPFDHPLFVLFSSGTTGAPKAIVHGHGGTLLEHLKEHRLHCDLRPGDALCFQTTAGWMMWNWTASALAAGARVVLYDGSVSYPERDSFLRMAEREGVTVLGMSPALLQYLVDAGVTGTRERLRLVRTVLSTGSVLSAHLHRWAKAHFADAPVESISGGTDILGCFVLGSPWSDTFEGESSSIGLGFDLRAWSDGGPAGEGTGELVCMAPFPSRPVGFLHDRDGARLKDAYYAQHPGVWTHGDLVSMTPHGTVRVLGRCDGVLNIRGIRIGPSEIYDVIAGAIPEVALAMAVDADAPENPGGKRLVLFVVLRSGATLDRALTLRIKKALRERASPAHVPELVVAVDELPSTFNGKLSESAMQDVLNGRPVRNRAALRNPGSVEKAIEAMRNA
ncbi:MAG TPA: acetoacetate--CoA ligase [Polyangiaceae bacterium]|jgi:acetoacetyl-CoA synthetase|nr:acetoacetate--CoA ligase [Polyangiaceae bacterium]